MSLFYERETVPTEPRWGKLPMRLRWVQKQRGGRRARVRCFWHTAVRGYAYEVCDECGRPVGATTGSWWSAPDDLWHEVVGTPADDHSGVLCPPCFTLKAERVGVLVRWEAVQENQFFDLLENGWPG